MLKTALTVATLWSLAGIAGADVPACPVPSTLGGGYSGAANPGDILVSAYFSNYIVRFDPVAEAYSLYGGGSVSTLANGLVFAPGSGMLRMGDTGTGSIRTVDANGVDQGLWATSAGSNLQMGAYGPDGSLWVPDQSSNWLVRALRAAALASPSRSALGRPPLPAWSLTPRAASTSATPSASAS